MGEIYDGAGGEAGRVCVCINGFSSLCKVEGGLQTRTHTHTHTHSRYCARCIAARARVAMLVLTLLSGACIASVTKSVHGANMSSAFTTETHTQARRRKKRTEEEEGRKRRIFWLVL